MARLAQEQSAHQQHRADGEQGQESRALAEILMKIAPRWMGTFRRWTVARRLAFAATVDRRGRAVAMAAGVDHERSRDGRKAA